jgi:hypothetical protein
MLLARSKARTDFNTTLNYLTGSLLLNIFTILYTLTLQFSHKILNS